jgi:endonuclease YncB( thermonuclease family)
MALSDLTAVLTAVMAFVIPFDDTAAAGEITGIPRIVDGDTVRIGTTSVRLEGIDSPETDQICLDSDGRRWTCGIEARDRLVQKAGSALWTCRTNSVDVYGRFLATCTPSGANINRWLVQEGWALSFTRYSHEYDADEAQARERKAGLWRGAFIAPWEWRHRTRHTSILGALSVPTSSQSVLLSAASEAGAPSPECTIKGNVNRAGECIYHLPGGRYYATVVMDQSKGKRWFCTEVEAIAAGCRAPNPDYA